MEFNTYNMAKNIVMYRTRLNMSPKELANICGLSLSQIHNLERGKGAKTTLKHLKDIADALKVSIDDLLIDDLNIYCSSKADSLLDNHITNAFYSLTTKEKEYILKALYYLKLLNAKKVGYKSEYDKKSLYIDEIVYALENYSLEDQRHFRTVIKEIMQIRTGGNINNG